MNRWSPGSEQLPGTARAAVLGAAEERCPPVCAEGNTKLLHGREEGILLRSLE